MAELSIFKPEKSDFSLQEILNESNSVLEDMLSSKLINLNLNLSSSCAYNLYADCAVIQKIYVSLMAEATKVSRLQSDIFVDCDLKTLGEVEMLTMSIMYFLDGTESEL